jgi:hypothetical protein
MEPFRQIASGRLPVPRRPQKSVQNDERRFARPAQVAMEKKHGRKKK